MKKIEIIWRELLFEAIEKGKFDFTQKDLATKFGFSTSTIFQALKHLRSMGAVRVTGRFFKIEDIEKILYHWASFRTLEKDIIFKGRVGLPLFEIEGRVPPKTIFGGYTAARIILQDTPADYGKVYLYVNIKNQKSKIKNGYQSSKTLNQIQKRYEFTKGSANFFVFKADPYMNNYGEHTTIAQTFVDLWNLGDWYAKEFTNALKEKIDELLS